MATVHEASGDGCPPEELARDWLSTCGAVARPDLVEAVCADSWPTVRWMAELGHRWSCERSRLPGGLALRHDGGGSAFVRRWHLAAARRGIPTVAGTDVTGLRRRRDGGWVVEAERAPRATGGDRRRGGGGVRRVRGEPSPAPGIPRRAVGRRRRARHPLEPGRAPRLPARPRGAGDRSSRRGPRRALPPAPTPRRVHRRPPQGGGQPPLRVPVRATVDRTGARLVDERAAPSNRVYASIGRWIVEAPGRRAFQVFDRSVGEAGVLPAGYGPPEVELAGPSELCERVRRSCGDGVTGPVVEPEALLRAVDEGRRLAAQHTGSELERTGRYWVYVVEPALTFTFHGLDVDLDGAVRRAEAGGPGVFAAGEAVGGLYDDNYLGGTGLLAGAVLGRQQERR